MKCNAINHTTGARCDRRSGHGGHHESADGRAWPTRREASGEVESRDTSFDLACVEREDVDGSERWWVMPGRERVAEGAATKGVPMVMFAFHERDSAELVCQVLNTTAFCDAMSMVADDEAVAA